MRRGGRLAAMAVLAALLLGIGGCVPSTDPDQSRLCRVALVALVDRDAHVAIESQSAVAAAGSVALQIVALTGETRRNPDRVVAECRFAVDAGTGPDSLIGLRFGRDELTPTQLFILKRFWLGSPESDGADPQPVAMWGAAPDLSPTIAHGLQDGLAAVPGMAVYGLLAAAYALVYGLVGRINLAFGAFAAVGAAASLTGLGFVAHPGLGAVLSVTLAAAFWAGALHGVAVARWVFLPLGGATGQQGLVATVGLALVLGEYLRIAQGPTPLWFTPLRATPIGVASAGSFVVTLTPLALLVAAGFAAGAATLLLVMARTQFGRNWRALADDTVASALMGVDAVRTFSLTFALASCLAAAAGAVTVLIYGSFGGSYGTVLGLKALLAAVLGGIGSVPGALLGGVAIAIVEAAWSAFFSNEYRDLALFVALSIMLVLRPGGFLGFRELGPRRV